MDLTAEKTSGAIFAALVALIVSSCGVDEPTLDPETYAAELEQWRSENPTPPPAAELELTHEERQRLEALGYLAGEE